MKTIPCNYWVSHLTGYTKNKVNFEFEDNLTFVKNNCTKSRYCAGLIEHRKLQNLYDINRNEPVKPNFAILYPKVGCNLDVIDLQFKYAQYGKSNSLFQVASNFNGLENTHSKSECTNPTFLHDYIFDKTQGPKASMGCGASAISRLNCYKGYQDIQTPNNGLNILKYLDRDFTISNGYALMNEDQLNSPLSFDRNNLSLVRSKCKYILQRECDVTYNSRGDMDFSIVPPGYRVDQIFCSALNLSEHCYRNQHQYLNEKSRFILNLAYYSTFLAASKYKYDNLFLTMIGGGVFGNKPVDIVSEIGLALQYVKFTHKIDINLVCYDKSQFLEYSKLIENTSDFSNFCSNIRFIMM